MKHPNISAIAVTWLVQIIKFIGQLIWLDFKFVRVPTGQGKVREICFFFKVREKSGNFEKWSGKLENLKKSGKSQGILKLWFVQTKK